MKKIVTVVCLAFALSFTVGAVSACGENTASSTSSSSGGMPNGGTEDYGKIFEGDYQEKTLEEIRQFILTTNYENMIADIISENSGVCLEGKWETTEDDGEYTFDFSGKLLLGENVTDYIAEYKEKEKETTYISNEEEGYFREENKEYECYYYDNGQNTYRSIFNLDTTYYIESMADYNKEILTESKGVYPHGEIENAIDWLNFDGGFYEGDTLLLNGIQLTEILNSESNGVGSCSMAQTEDLVKIKIGGEEETEEFKGKFEIILVYQEEKLLACDLVYEYEEKTTNTIEKRLERITPYSGTIDAPNDLDSYKNTSNLTYRLSEDKTYYSVYQIDDTDEEEIFIPAMFNNLPVTTIDDVSFPFYSSVTHIHISENINKIETDFDCRRLVNITVDEKNQTYKSIEGNLYSKDGTRLIRYVEGKREESFIIPEGVTTIETRAFMVGSPCIDNCNWCSGGICKGCACNMLKSIIISNGVTLIKYAAFAGRNSLVAIEIPNSVVEIEGYVFRDCNDLTSITYLGTLAEWGTIEKGEDIFYSELKEEKKIICLDGIVGEEKEPDENNGKDDENENPQPVVIDILNFDGVEVSEGTVNAFLEKTDVDEMNNQVVELNPGVLITSTETSNKSGQTVTTNSTVKIISGGNSYTAEKVGDAQEDYCYDNGTNSYVYENGSLTKKASLGLETWNEGITIGSPQISYEELKALGGTLVYYMDQQESQYTKIASYFEYQMQQDGIVTMMEATSILVYNENYELVAYKVEVASNASSDLESFNFYVYACETAVPYDGTIESPLA